MSGKHAKDGEHHSGQTAKDTGYTGKHREQAPVFEVRPPAEQAAYIQQQRESGAK